MIFWNFYKKTVFDLFGVTSRLFSGDFITIGPMI